MSRELTAHRTIGNATVIKEDINHNISIFASNVGEGGACTVYSIEYGEAPVQLQFPTTMQVGLTNEALLAIVHDRLTSFQAGPSACQENDTALDHIDAALCALRSRTVRRVLQRKLQEKAGQHQESTMSTETKPKKPRVYAEAETLHIGKHAFEFADLGKWKTWSLVESAIKALRPQITSREVSDIENLTADIPVATYGRTECMQAIRSVYPV